MSPEHATSSRSCPGFVLGTTMKMSCPDHPTPGLVARRTNMGPQVAGWRVGGHKTAIVAVLPALFPSPRPPAASLDLASWFVTVAGSPLLPVHDSAIPNSLERVARMKPFGVFNIVGRRFLP